jgi:putative DNA-binding protein
LRRLAELQRTIADAVIDGDPGRAASSLHGGRDPCARLEIHVRHYEASLVTALHMKFPATHWLVGSELVAAAARAYVHARPPTRPCIAEYGRSFPAFLTHFARARGLCYLRMFAELELAAAEAATAIELPPVAWEDLASFGSERLLGCTVGLQLGARYLRSSWRVDELLKMYLSESTPERFEVGRSQTCMEVRGARGGLRIARIERAPFAFRSALAAGRSIGDAADRALRYEPTFDAGAALYDLVQAGLATSVNLSPEGAAL